MSFWNQFLGASECIVLGFFKHILCPSGAIHHWSVMACDCKCGQVLQAELAELKQRRQELREVASCLGWMGVWCFQSATFLCLACVRPSKLTKHTWRPRRSERPSWSRRSLVLFLPVDGTMYVLSEIYPKVLTIYWDVDKIPPALYTLDPSFRQLVNFRCRTCRTCSDRWRSSAQSEWKQHKLCRCLQLAHLKWQPFTGIMYKQMTYAIENCIQND